MLRPSLLATALLLAAGCGGGEQSASGGAPAEAAESPRIVALGGSVAETLYALGADSLLVARDASATVPAAVLQKPSVGYYRMIGAEGVLSTNPTLVLADPEAGPPPALQQIAAAGVEVVRLPGGASPDLVEAQIRAIAAAVGRPEAGMAVIDSMGARLDAVRLWLETHTERPRVLFVLGQSGGGTFQMGGTGTHADAFIRLAGGTNAFGNAEGYKAMTAEAVVAAEPEVILLMARTVELAGGLDALLARPELRMTPAVQNGRVVVLPDASLSFGPSLGAYVERFARALHPEAGAPAAAPAAPAAR